MNLIRNLIALLLLVSSTAAIAQNVITLTVSVGPGGVVDYVARNLGRELGTILGKRAIINNLPGEVGARAVREFRDARADGNQILILAAFLTQPAPDLSGLVPVATIVGETGNYRWVGVFAPPGTPAGIVNGLERAIIAALNSPGYSAGVASIGNPLVRPFTPTPGDGAQLAQLVAQTPVGVATPPPSTAPSGQPAGTISQAPAAAVPSSAGSAIPARDAPGGALGATSGSRTRTLLAPRGYEMLVPSDVIVGLGWKVDSNRNPMVGKVDPSSMRVAPGRDFEEARKNQWDVTSGGSTMQDRHLIKASELTGKVGLGWVAWVLLADWWPEGYGYPNEGWTFVAGRATLDEAIAAAFSGALRRYREQTNGPIRTFFVQAGVSAKPDYALYKRLGTFTNYHALPFSFDCDMPATAKDAQDYGFTPRVPETPEEFVRYVRTQQSRQYLRRPIPGVAQDSRWYGCWKVFRNNPISETSEPVFIISPF